MIRDRGEGQAMKRYIRDLVVVLLPNFLLITAALEGANLKDVDLCFATMSSGLSTCIRDVFPLP